MTRLLFLGAALAVLSLGCFDQTPTGTGPTESGNTEPAANGAAVFIDGNPPAGGEAAYRRYEVIIENLTPATGAGASQPFSPPVLATHHRNLRMFQVGDFASNELAQIAEDAINGPMVSLLRDSGRTADVVEGGGVILPGGEARYEIRAGRGARWLSAVFMLVNSNDAFSGVDRLRLPAVGSVTHYPNAYDAGSEENTELASDIPGPCCGNPNQGPDERRRIRPHDGILGVGDLDPAEYGWTDPTAKLTITRIQ